MFMKKVHHIWITVYCKPEDDESTILENLNNFFPFDLKEEKIPVKRKSAMSIEERKIVIFQVHLDKQRHIKKWIPKLNEILGGDQKKLLLKQIESRLDEGNHFFLRFDKKKLIEEQKFLLTDHGNCFHIKMSIAAFPTSRDSSLEVVKKIFQQ